MTEAPVVHVVEDDDSSRKATTRVLRASGHAVEVYGSADEFLEKMPLGPGCLVLDLQRRLRAEGSKLPIIVVTANAQAGVREEVERLGCLAYLQKPCDGGTILSLLRSLATASF